MTTFGARTPHVVCSSMPITMSDSTDSVFSKVFAHLPSSLREENLGYEHSAPLGHLKHEPTPAVEYPGLMLKNGSFKGMVLNLIIVKRLVLTT